jgi:hypothetical protein
VHPASPIRRCCGAALLALFLGGCAGQWTPHSDAPRLLSRGRAPDVRLVRARGDTVVVRQAVLRGDSVVSLDENDRRAVALGDVERVAAWHGWVERTLGATALAATITLVGLLLWVASLLRSEHY